MIRKIIFCILIFPIVVSGQSFHPAAEHSGSNAIHKDSSILKAWANGIYLERGYLNAADTNYTIQGSNRVSFGQASNALGMAEGNSMDVVSLGDGGVAILTFESPVVNGLGYDFAVFENSFSDTYLELAHVAVSTDGVHYVSFESTSETSVLQQVGPFDQLQPSYLNNLAGKYRAGYGVPFDLEELVDSPNIDLQNIRFVKIQDCVGSIEQFTGTMDSHGSMINDPFPTPFESGGFDLDGVGVIHNQDEFASIEDHGLLQMAIYPNPSKGQFYFQKETFSQVTLQVFDQMGRMHVQDRIQNNLVQLDYNLKPGVYIIRVSDGDQTNTKKLIIQ